jgi:ribosome maturation factor RimP
MDLKQKIEQYAEPFLGQIDAFIIDVQIASEGQKNIVQVFVDTETGITIDQCAEVSRQLAKILELHNVLHDSYVLQVSSPGLKKPLKLLRQYNKNIGRIFKVRFLRESGVESIVAKLTSVDGVILTFVTENGNAHAIPFSEVIESIEELPW